VFVTITVIVLLWQLRQPLLLFALSLATAAAVRPMIEYMTARGIARGIALLITYLSILILTVGLLWFVGGPLIRDIEQASNDFIRGYEAIKANWPESSILFQRTIAEQLPRAQELVNWMTEAEGFQNLLGVTTNLASALGSLGLILILSLYWSADSIRFERLFLTLIDVNKRATARTIWRGIENAVGAYIRSELAQSLLAGVLLLLGYRLIGIEYPVLLAVLSAIAWLIPWFGAVIAIIPPLLVGISNDLTSGIIAAVYTIVVFVILEHFIEPRIFRRKSYSSVVLVLVILVLTEAYGLLGLIFAPLVSATIQIVSKYLIQPPLSYDTSSIEQGDVLTTDISSLREQLAETKDGLQARDTPPTPELLNLLERLDKLITESDRYLQDKMPMEIAPKNTS
jgi:predicted PurR-regulated permease PerM